VPPLSHQDPPYGTGLVLVASIALLAGITDATGLMLTGNFVSFMTGNTTRAARRAK
jgi:uncharacterized membrane protein YoaK (UPF0700 family)